MESTTQTQTQVNGYVELFKQIKEEVGDSQTAALLVEQIAMGRLIGFHCDTMPRTPKCRWASRRARSERCQTDRH